MRPGIFLIGYFFLSCATSWADDSAAPTFHEELTQLTVGSFSTLQHAIENSGYGVAEAEIVQIWQDRDDGVWFYQEQAFLGESAETIDPAKKDAPYFARVINSTEIETGVVRRTVHKLKNPESARGGWRNPALFDGISVDDLAPSECAITVTRIAKNFWRSESEKCPNAYKGAAYALSLGIVTDDGYANWDRGFSSKGDVVWGPTMGGYVFRRTVEQ